MKSETTTFYRYFPISQRDKNWGLYVITAGESRIAPHTIEREFAEDTPVPPIESKSTETQNPNAIELAIARIQNEFERDLNTELLARELGVSYSWFRHTFAAYTGLSPHQYLLELRLVRARSLLTEAEFSVKEIATQTGFKDEFYFSRLFRQKLHYTPSQWRNRSRRHK